MRGKAGSISYAAVEAKRLGVSKRYVEQSIFIGDHIGAVADRLRGTPVERRRGDLLKLARIRESDPVLFKKVVDIIGRQKISLSAALRSVGRAGPSREDGLLKTVDAALQRRGVAFLERCVLLHQLDLALRAPDKEVGKKAHHVERVGNSRNTAPPSSL